MLLHPRWRQRWCSDPPFSMKYLGCGSYRGFQRGTSGEMWLHHFSYSGLQCREGKDMKTLWYMICLHLARFQVWYLMDFATNWSVRVRVFSFLLQERWWKSVLGDKKFPHLILLNMTLKIDSLNLVLDPSNFPVHARCFFRSWSKSFNPSHSKKTGGTLGESYDMIWYVQARGWFNMV